MSALLAVLGLEPKTTSYAASLIITNFAIAHLVTAPRFAKRRAGFDHNKAPREDIAKYGERKVAEGKMTRAQLDRIKRLEAAHANAVEHFPVFFGSILFALHAGLPTETVNSVGVYYALSRIAYALAYVYIDDENVSVVRSVLWWVGSITCMYTLVQGGKAINM